MSEESFLDLSFASGEELLVSYWGHLTGGGLVIDDPGIEVGQVVSMRIVMASSKTTYRLYGTVLKREPDSKKSIIAFRPGEAHDMLLSEARASSPNVAPRRYVRFALGTKIGTLQAGKATLVNLSREGCCLLLDEPSAALEVDNEVTLVHEEIHAIGVVVWSRGLERGLRMTTDEASPLLKALCGDLG